MGLAASVANAGSCATVCVRRTERSSMADDRHPRAGRSQIGGSAVSGPAHGQRSKYRISLISYKEVHRITARFGGLAMSCASLSPPFGLPVLLDEAEPDQVVISDMDLCRAIRQEWAARRARGEDCTLSAVANDRLRHHFGLPTRI